MSDVITIQPGSGSFTDASGNVFTINADDNDTAEINGQPVTPNGESTKTGALQLNADNVYAQDQSSGQWYLLASKGTPGLWEWQPVSAPPDSTSSGGNFVLSSGDSTTAALGSDQTPMVFVSGSPDASGSSGSTNSPPAASGSLSIQPGAGSFTDPSGNIFMIVGGSDTADINGQPITANGESTNTGVLELSNGSVYGQDQNSGQWYQLASKGAPGLYEWQPVSAVPASN
ncbi:MAG: hypothetical protein WA864_15670 [Acetobacteraceae bacterium]|jgi:uncharacterized Zn-binding protein involved in type VI secretion